jgi:hypothetical protein
MIEPASAQLKGRMEEQKESILEIGDGILEHRDIETNPPPLEKKQPTSCDSNQYLISWDSDDDPANPKNWSDSRKWIETIIVSLFTFIAPVSSSMIAPALNTISAELSITEETERALVLSIFVLGYAMGPLVLGPLSEV